ncbi:DUF2971 domain-containing protein [Clostridium estertheticum]|uniref:DUF2971 domain-containing protein n=1 Tax=Clostridium estertheticum TaxID=238834 RepID=UPI001C0C16CB|nr:DUF2971 domain-containing protein [Clostridium estertheticum]MBU3198509.1 DUF2971 domain-containing protein [Clostridium estertheticum]WAG64491.1 DUF2971 domain-containing protein [Clostridium estertheticum]
MTTNIKDQTWKVEIIDRRFPLSNVDKGLSEVNLSCANMIIKNQLPTSKKLYKYKPNILEYNKENLENDKLWLSYPNSLNDPFECEISICQNKELIDLNIQPGPECCFENINTKIDNPSAAYAYYNAILVRLMETNLRPSIDNSKCKVAIGSLTEVKNSILMWSHYANEHKGFCIEYNVLELLDIKKNELYPIIYNNELPDITITRSDNLEESILNTIIKASLTKATDWSYENEWRILSHNNYPTAGVTGFSVKMPIPTAIYLGCKISSDDKNILINICTKRKIKVYQMVRLPNKYELSFADIESCHNNEIQNEWVFTKKYMF